MSSAFFAISTIALIRSFSLGVLPVVGSVVMSLTLKIPNCMSRLPLPADSAAVAASSTITGPRSD